MISKLTRDWFEAQLSSIPVGATHVYHFNPFSLFILRSALSRHGISPTILVFPASCWNRVQTDNRFQCVVDVVTHPKLLKAGMLGTMYGLSMWSDAAFSPEDRFVPDGLALLVGYRSKQTHAVALDYAAAEGRHDDALKQSVQSPSSPAN